MNKYTLVALSVVGGILSGLAWMEWCSGLILLIAFVPFFLIENHLYENRERYTQNAFFIYCIPGFVIFSLIALGWMRVASIAGAICVILGLSFLMTFTLWLAHTIRVRAGNLIGIVSLFAFWLCFEYLTLNSNIISPWINLGNGLAKDILFIQWYEITGTAGGSLWILASNLLLAIILINSDGRGRRIVLPLTLWLLVIIIPSVISVTRYRTIKPSEQDKTEIVIIQPNTDPYTEKFKVPFIDQLKKVIALSSSAVTGDTKWIITPETSVDDPVNLDDLNGSVYIRMFRDLITQYPKASVMTGMVSYRLYPSSPEAPTNSARETDTSGFWYDHFNSALKIDTGKVIEVYHKSKLVPGIEMQFSNGPTRLISRILPYLGGTKWGYGIQKDRICFEHQISSQKIAPIICYESVFGKYVTEYVKKGAEALFIITNDGWWKGTTGYKQHLAYASLRAIETRRPVARSANTGVSCLIDIRGKRTIETKWWTQAILKGSIYPEKRMTFYVKHGDYLMKVSFLITSLIILVVFIVLPLRKKIRTV